MNREAIREEIREKTSLSFSRSGGPGGQNVNKRETKVSARLQIDALEIPDEASLRRLKRRLASRLSSDGVLVLQASEERSQAMNRQQALERMEALILAALRPDPKPRKATRPSRAARERRLISKKKRGALKVTRRSGRVDDD